MSGEKSPPLCGDNVATWQWLLLWTHAGGGKLRPGAESAAWSSSGEIGTRTKVMVKAFGGGPVTCRRRNWQFFAGEEVFRTQSRADTAEVTRAPANIRGSGDGPADATIDRPGHQDMTFLHRVGIQEAPGTTGEIWPLFHLDPLLSPRDEAERSDGEMGYVEAIMKRKRGSANGRPVFDAVTGNAHIGSAEDGGDG
jgi:hypothetical protein